MIELDGVVIQEKIMQCFEVVIKCRSCSNVQVNERLERAVILSGLNLCQVTSPDIGVGGNSTANLCVRC